MSYPQFAGVLAIALGLAGQATRGQEVRVKSVAELSGLPARIAFGSCAHQDKPQPVLRTALAQRPDVFIYLGDNIYGDTRDMELLRAKYRQLGEKPEFRALREQVAVLAIWDDHDYGQNDAGKEYPQKEASREIFFDFWRVPASSPRRTHPGIYGAHRFERDGHVLQVILLDTRTFRDPLRRNRRPLPAGSPYKNDYQPDPDPAKSLLGQQQWEWLEARLREPADLRLVCTSIQFGHEYNGWESWTNLPREQERMVALIRKTEARGVIFLSGDVHWGEISVRRIPGLYPLYDVTASGITEDWDTVEPNRFRLGDVVRENHFGMLEINWQPADPTVDLKIIDRQGQTRVEHRVKLSELGPQS